jgi:hypothetical protein
LSSSHKKIIVCNKSFENLHFLILFNHTIETRPYTTSLIFYFLHFRWHSSFVTWRVSFSPKMTKNNHFFVINLFKINIFWFSSITRLKQDLTRRVWYVIFFILDEIPHVSLEGFNIWLSSLYWGINYLSVHCGQWGPCLQ